MWLVGPHFRLVSDIINDGTTCFVIDGACMTAMALILDPDLSPVGKSQRLDHFVSQTAKSHFEGLTLNLLCFIHIRLISKVFMWFEKVEQKISSIINIDLNIIRISIKISITFCAMSGDCFNLIGRHLYSYRPKVWNNYIISVFSILFKWKVLPGNFQCRKAIIARMALLRLPAYMVIGECIVLLPYWAL